MGGWLGKHTLVLETYEFLEREFNEGKEYSSQQLLYVASRIVWEVLNAQIDASHEDPADVFGYYSRDVAQVMRLSPFLPLSEEHSNMTNEFGEDGYNQKSFGPKLVNKDKRRP